MQTFIIENDIKVFTVQAESFPNGVLAAHQKIHSVVPFSTDRKYFGISRPESGTISYWAAAEEREEGEGEKLGFGSFTIPHGEYAFVELHDYMKDTSVIGKTFQELLAIPDLDPNGFCLEWYISDKDVRCMVPLKK